MIRRLEAAERIVEVLGLRNSVLSDDATIDPEWLARTGSRVVVQESGRHIEPAEAPLIASAFDAMGADSLLAIVGDPLVVSPEAYELDVTAEDLIQVSGKLAGVNFALLDSQARQCVLFTTRDFKLIAGPLEFVTAVAGEPSIARQEFCDFAADQPGPLREAAERAASFMNWLDDDR